MQRFVQKPPQKLVFLKYMISEILMDLYLFPMTMFDKLSFNAASCQMSDSRTSVCKEIELVVQKNCTFYK